MDPLKRSLKLITWIILFKNMNYTYSDPQKVETEILYMPLNRAKLSVTTVHYTLITTPMNWNDAQTHCKKLYGDFDGTLANVDESEIVTQIFNVVTSQNTFWNTFWVGLHCDDDKCQDVSWSDGNPFIKSVDMDVDRGGGAKEKRYFFADKYSSTDLKRDVGSAVKPFVCQHTNNSSYCGVACSGQTNCNTTGYSVTNVNDDDCRTLCRTKQGCWMFWHDGKQCLMGVTGCFKATLYSSSSPETVDGNNNQKGSLDSSTLSEVATRKATMVATESDGTSTAAAKTVTVFATQTVTVTASEAAPSQVCVPGCTDTITVHSTHSLQCPDVIQNSGPGATLMTSFSSVGVDTTSQHLLPTSGLATDDMRSSSHMSVSQTTPHSEGQLSHFTTSTLYTLVVAPTLSTPMPSQTPSITSSQQLNEIRASIVEKLTMPHNNLSKTRRTKISVFDSRPVAMVSGATACIFLCCSMAVIVVLDIPVLVKSLKRILRRCKR